MQSINKKSDGELVKLSLDDPDRFELIVDRYEKKLLRYVKRILGIRGSEAEDVLQNTFIKIYKNLNAFDSDLKFSSWAYRIAHNEAINYLKGLKSKKVISIDTDQDDFKLIEVLASDIDIHDQFKKSEWSENVKKLINELPFKYKEVILLHYLEEKTYEELSDILEKPMGTIATLINRAKKQLKNKIQSLNYKF